VRFLATTHDTETRQHVAMAGVQRFAVAVAGVLLDTGGRVLLIRERHGALQYGLPGGLVPDYESPQETLSSR
jgi:8-oxo-dGTP pyrophosphatase MutT (NUDIX family)